jgi:hypothetical protein
VARALETHSAGAPPLAGDGCGRVEARALEPHSVGAPHERRCLPVTAKEGGRSQGGKGGDVAAPGGMSAGLYRRARPGGQGGGRVRPTARPVRPPSGESADSAHRDGLPVSAESHTSGSWQHRASPTRALDAAGSWSWRRGALDAAGSSAEAKAALGAACAAGEARVTMEKKEENDSRTVLSGGSEYKFARISPCFGLFNVGRASAGFQGPEGVPGNLMFVWASCFQGPKKAVRKPKHLARVQVHLVLSKEKMESGK